MISTQTKSFRQKLNDFIDKWRFVLFLYLIGVSLVPIGIWGTAKHYPELSELHYVKGKLQKYSIVDRHNNHKISLKLRHQDIPFVFKKVSYFPSIKKNLPYGSTIEVWVDKNQFSRGKSPEIWQLKIDGEMMMAIESISNYQFMGSKKLILFAIFYIFGGVFLTLLLKSNKPWATEKLYPTILKIIYISSVCTALYLTIMEFTKK